MTPVTAILVAGVFLPQKEGVLVLKTLGFEKKTNSFSQNVHEEMGKVVKFAASSVTSSDSLSHTEPRITC